MEVADLISGALRLLGVLAEGEVPTAQAQTDAFNVLNDMLDSFSNERLLINTILREQFALTSNQATYKMGSQTISISTTNSLTIGSSYQILSLGTTTTLQWQAVGDPAVTPAVGDVFTATATSGLGTGTVQPTGVFNTTRPQRIENALIQILGTNPTAEIPIEIINKDQYSQIVVKTITSSIPLYLYNDDAYPVTNLNLWPVPSVAATLALYSWKPLANFTGPTQTLPQFPPGYNRMLRYNLAVELGPEYGEEPSDKVLAIAIQSKKNIKRMNIKNVLMSTDRALLPARSAFNWLKGDTT